MIYTCTGCNNHTIDPREVCHSCEVAVSFSKNVQACSQCGYTVDPNCDVCKGTGEYDARAVVPQVNAVGVAGTDAPVNRIGAHDSIPDIGALKEQATAWNAVCVALDEASPGWRTLSSRGIDSAVKAIQAFAPSKVEDSLAPVIDADTATVMEALDFGQFSESMICGVLTGGVARGIARSTQQALSRYLQRQYDVLYANHEPTSHGKKHAFNTFDMRRAFEDWMTNEAKIAVGSTDPYPAGLERSYWRVWQAAFASFERLFRPQVKQSNCEHGDEPSSVGGSDA